MIKFNRRRVELANQKLYARRSYNWAHKTKQKELHTDTARAKGMRRVGLSSGRNPLLPGQIALRYSKSVRLHALHTNYETRRAIAVHCYLICPPRRPSQSSSALLSLSLSLSSRKLELQIILYAQQHAGSGSGERQVGLADTLIAI